LDNQAAVSAVIAVYNSASMLDECLGALSRSAVKPLECIVVDDASTDGAQLVAERHGARVIVLEDRRGPANARNLGALHAHGDLILFLDADVCIHADALGRILVVMLFGLLISPISWTHHYAWLLPLVIWLVHGPLRDHTRRIGWAWLALAYVSPPWILVFTDSRGWTTSGHSYLAWVGSLYVLATLATLGYLAALSRRSGRSPLPSPHPAG